VLGIIGPNGSGKSTLLLSLALLLKPAAGTIAYYGVPVTSPGQILQLHRRLAVVLQEPLLLNNTVWDNVTLGMRLRGVKKEELSGRAHRWLERFGISHLARRQARLLSGGEARRVSLARAFVLQPEVLLLDEPFNALDMPTRQALMEELKVILGETQVTTVMVTHDRNEALALADRVAIIMGGSIRQIAAPEEVFGSPVDEDVAAFIEAGNILRGVVAAQRDGLALIDVNGQVIQAVSDIKSGCPVTVYLHYEDIIVGLPAAEAASTSARNHLKGIIVKIFPFGSQLKVTLDCGFPLAAVITKRSWEELGIKIGQEVVFTFKASSVHLISRYGQPASNPVPER